MGKAYRIAGLFLMIFVAWPGHAAGDRGDWMPRSAIGFERDNGRSIHSASTLSAPWQRARIQYSDLPNAKPFHPFAITELSPIGQRPGNAPPPEDIPIAATPVSTPVILLVTALLALNVLRRWRRQKV